MTTASSSLTFHGIPAGPIADLVCDLVGDDLASSSLWLGGRKGKRLAGPKGVRALVHADLHTWLVVWADEKGEHTAEFRSRVDWERVK